MSSTSSSTAIIAGTTNDPITSGMAIAVRFTSAQTPTANTATAPTSNPLPSIARSTGPLVEVGIGIARLEEAFAPSAAGVRRGTRGRPPRARPRVVMIHATPALASTTRDRRGVAANDVPIMPEPYSLPIAIAPITAATIAPIKTRARASATMSLLPDAPGGEGAAPTGDEGRETRPSRMRRSRRRSACRARTLTSSARTAADHGRPPVAVGEPEIDVLEVVLLGRQPLQGEPVAGDELGDALGGSPSTSIVSRSVEVTDAPALASTAITSTGCAVRTMAVARRRRQAATRRSRRGPIARG